MKAAKGVGISRRSWVVQMVAVFAILIGLFGATPHVAAGESGAQRGIEADSARWAAIGRYYDSEARGLEADGARWVALGKHYSDLMVRGREADSARWASRGAYFLGLCQSGKLAC